MTLPLTAAPAAACTTFMNFPLHTDLPSLEAEVAILGIPYGAPYAMDQVANDHRRAPRAKPDRRAGARGLIGALARAGTFERNSTR